jgi:Uma2 family endonuclease
MLAVAEKLMTYEDYLFYDDGTDNRYELVDGELVEMAQPTMKHILIAKLIEKTLEAEINRLNKPWMCFREIGVRTGIRKSRIADVCVLTNEQVTEMMNESAVFDTPPRLVVEIVSPDSVQRDYRHKRSEYATLGIPEYWIVDPKAKKITVLWLEEGFYEETVFTLKQKIISPTFTEFPLTVEQIVSL